MVKNGHKVNFKHEGIYSQNGELLCSATLVNHLYMLNTQREVLSNLTCTDNLHDVVLWHRRTGHLNFSDVNKLPECAEEVNLVSNKNKNLVTCATCLEGKQTSSPFNNIGSKASRPLQLIHTDLYGPMEQMSLGGMKYFITFMTTILEKFVLIY